MPPAWLLALALIVAGARGFSFWGKKDGDNSEDPLIEEEDGDDPPAPIENIPDLPPWYNKESYPYDYGMGDEMGNMFRSHNEDFFKLKDDYQYEEPKKTFEEIYEEFFRFHDSDKDNALDQEELRRALIHSKVDIWDAEGNDLLEDAMNEDDKDKDGKLSLNEFLNTQRVNTSGLKSLGNIEL
ncbi:uncharacterized protein LOC144151516 [Haemaphysalis longicornis]